MFNLDPAHQQAVIAKLSGERAQKERLFETVPLGEFGKTART